MRKMFYIFNMKTKCKETITFSNEFFIDYNKYRKANCLPYSVEDLVSFYYITHGWEVNRLYLQRKYGLDLIVTKDNIVFNIEVKSETDNLRFSQLDFIFENPDSLVIWVVPDLEDVADLEY